MLTNYESRLRGIFVCGTKAGNPYSIKTQDIDFSEKYLIKNLVKMTSQIFWISNFPEGVCP